MARGSSIPLGKIPLTIRVGFGQTTQYSFARTSTTRFYSVSSLNTVFSSVILRCLPYRQLGGYLLEEATSGGVVAHMADRGSPGVA